MVSTFITIERYFTGDLDYTLGAGFPMKTVATLVFGRYFYDEGWQYYPAGQIVPGQQ
jgi:hypothetical protein